MDNNEKKQTLADVLSGVLGADFDAEKLKALESGVNAYVGKTTVPKPVFNSSNNKLKELQAKLAERAEKMLNIKSNLKQRMMPLMIIGLCKPLKMARLKIQ